MATINIPTSTNTININENTDKTLNYNMIIPTEVCSMSYN